MANRSQKLAGLDDYTWEWTLKTLDDLNEIARVARSSAKAAASLDEKVSFQRIAKRAEAGRTAVAKIFGDAK